MFKHISLSGFVQFVCILLWNLVFSVASNKTKVPRTQTSCSVSTNCILVCVLMLWLCDKRFYSYGFIVLTTQANKQRHIIVCFFPWLLLFVLLSSTLFLTLDYSGFFFSFVIHVITSVFQFVCSFFFNVVPSIGFRSCICPIRFGTHVCLYSFYDSL